jgi:hypothetical protein
MISDQDLHNRFTYHRPDDTKQQKYIDIRTMGLEMATYIVENVSEPREAAIAVTKLEEIVMWANAGIARGK